MQVTRAIAKGPLGAAAGTRPKSISALVQAEMLQAHTESYMAQGAHHDVSGSTYIWLSHFWGTVLLTLVRPSTLVLPE